MGAAELVGGPLWAQALALGASVPPNAEGRPTMIRACERVDRTWR